MERGKISSTQIKMRFGPSSGWEGPPLDTRAGQGALGAYAKPSGPIEHVSK